MPVRGFSFHLEKTRRLDRKGNGEFPRCYRSAQGKKDSAIYPSSGYRNIRQIGKGAKSYRHVPAAARRRLTYFVGPGTPKERVQILHAAFRKAYDDPEFEKEYRKVINDDPSPINPEDYQAAIREIPRDPETIELYKKLSGGDPLPNR